MVRPPGGLLQPRQLATLFLQLGAHRPVELIELLQRAAAALDLLTVTTNSCQGTVITALLPADSYQGTKEK